jgi:hypothetical protein
MWRVDQILSFRAPTEGGGPGGPFQQDPGHCDHEYPPNLNQPNFINIPMYSHKKSNRLGMPTPPPPCMGGFWHCGLLIPQVSGSHFLPIDGMSLHFLTFWIIYRLNTAPAYPPRWKLTPRLKLVFISHPTKKLSPSSSRYWVGENWQRHNWVVSELSVSVPYVISTFPWVGFNQYTSSLPYSLLSTTSDLVNTSKIKVVCPHP